MCRAYRNKNQASLFRCVVIGPTQESLITQSWSLLLHASRPGISGMVDTCGALVKVCWNKREREKERERSVSISVSRAAYCCWEWAVLLGLCSLCNINSDALTHTSKLKMIQCICLLSSISPLPPSHLPLALHLLSFPIFITCSVSSSHFN